MKRILVYLFGLLPFATGAQKAEPADPKALHDFLYKQATDLVRPYLVLQDVLVKNAKTTKARADLERAISLFDRVLSINQENWAAAWFAGKAAQSLGNQERAYGFFKCSFEVQKKNPDVARELMLTCLDTGRAKEAVEVAEHAVQLTDSDAGLKANLALARLCAGDLVGADNAIDAALIQDPRDEISITLQKLIGEVRRGERKQPAKPADLQGK
jgi:Flp pilus assembly protein TadD